MGDLSDLVQRLSDKALILTEMADKTSNLTERTRLRGKAEGVSLAISFAEEYQRQGGYVRYERTPDGMQTTFVPGTRATTEGRSDGGDLA